MVQSRAVRYRDGYVAEAWTPDGGGSYYRIFCRGGKFYEADYSDILTDGFRTLSKGEKVRFVPDEVDGRRVARNILRVNQDYERLYYMN